MPTDCGKGGHYFFTVKDNQPILKQDIMTIWEAEPPSPPQVTRSNKRGGRVEQRRLWVSDILVGYSAWPYLAQVCRLERTVARKPESTDGRREESGRGVRELQGK